MRQAVRASYLLVGNRLFVNLLNNVIHEGFHRIPLGVVVAVYEANLEVQRFVQCIVAVFDAKRV